jgi:hypothetical protein
LSSRPSLQELEAARPDNGKKLQKGRETRDYWYKFLAATERHSEDKIREVYDMASSTAHLEISRAKRTVARLREIEQAERNGESTPQTYTLAPLLLPGQQVYTIASPPPRRPSLIVVLKISPDTMAKVATSARYPGTKRSARPPATNLLSIRTKTTLSRLRHDLEAYPRYPPPLATLSSKLEPPIECLDETELDRQRFATCETPDTLASYQAWRETKGADITRQNGAERLSQCLTHVIRKWRDAVLEAEEAGVEELGETFLQAVMRRLEDLGGVEREVEAEEREYEVWARDVECGW